MRRHVVPRALGLLVTGLLAVGSMPSAAQAAPGDRLWSATFSTGGNHFDQGDAIAVSPDGTRVFVTGDVRRDSAYATIAYDAVTGAQLWEAEWYAADPTDAVPVDIAVGPAGGRVYVTGELGDGSAEDFGTVAYDAATGARIWRKRYDGPAGADDIAYGLAVSPNGHTVYVVGESDGPGRSAATTVAYESKSGAQEWVSRQSPGHADNAFVDVAVSPDGSRLYATGWSGRHPRFLTASLEAGTGVALWTSTFTRPGDTFDLATDIGVTPDDTTLVVGGTTMSGGSNFNWATVAYDPAGGSRRWTRTVDRGQGDVLTGLAVSPNGDAVAVSGWRSVHETDAGTIVYRTGTGAIRWKRAYDGPAGGHDFAQAAAYSPDGNTVYITGQGDVANATRFLTIAYDAASGRKEWLRRSPDRGPVPFAGARALAVSPVGSAVYVTGLRYENERDVDFLTIAYGT